MHLIHIRYMYVNEWAVTRFDLSTLQWLMTLIRGTCNTATTTLIKTHKIPGRNVPSQCDNMDPGIRWVVGS